MRVISGEARGHTLKAPKGMTTRPMSDKIKGAVFSMLSNILSQLDREWGRVLDMYAGSGSIGIEALSRGADWVDFVEINAGVCRVVADNLEHTHFTNKARVNNRAVTAFLNSPPAPPGANHAKRAADGLHRRKGGIERKQEKSVLPIPVETGTPDVTEIDNSTIHNEHQYDIIFLDPPYADPKIPDTLGHVARSGLAKPGGLVIIGHSPRVTLRPSYGGETPDTPMIQLLRHRRHGDSAFTIFLAGNPADYGFKQGEPEVEEEEIDASEEEMFDSEPAAVLE